MQKIARIYLGGTGYTAAWYDGVTFDLVDRHTGEPTDVIINLENGGGKSTLLSLIFSCFETSQDRFLKHIHSKNNHFSQYFANDGTPGFIVVEWLMPPRSKGAAPYRLVTGQVVSVKPGPDGPDIDRLFFSFEEKADLALDSLPAPKLSTAPAATLADFSRWMYDQQARHAGDVYITRKQADWQKHLRDERLIDLEMLQMQVNFSAQEGGIDTAFLDFKTEPSFLSKFFLLTMDTQRGESVRASVSTVCGKLRKKPQYQRQLEELNKFKNILVAFDDEAARLRLAEAQQLGVKLTGARLAMALQARSAERAEKRKAEDAYEAEQRLQAASAAADYLTHLRRGLTLTSVWHRKRVMAAGELTATAKAAKQAALDAVKYVKAARLQAEIASFDYQIGELQAQRELASEGLKAFELTAETQGALLRTALFDEQTRLAGQARALEAGNQERDGKVKQLKEHHRRDDQGLKQLNAEHSQLTANENAYLSELRRLVTDRLLLDTSEAALDAANRWAARQQELLAKKAGHDVEERAHDTEARRQGETITAEGKAAATLDAEIRNENVFIAEGTAERERLSQLPALLEAIEADVVDPESSALPAKLDERLAACARELALSAVRLAELNATKQAIDDTGVAGNNPDVAAVLALLSDRGIATARPFNEYLAKTVPDALKARAIVLSNPARFSGIAVAETEFAAVKKMTWSEGLPVRPVVISPAAMDPETGRGEVVVPAATDAAYNRAAAAVLARSLANRISDEQARSAVYADRQSRTQSASEQVRAFVKRFGEGRLGAAQSRVDQKTTEMRAAQVRAEQARVRRDEEAAKAKSAKEVAVAKKAAADEAHRHEQALRRFAVQHEGPRQARLERIEEIKGQSEELEARKTLAEETWAELEEKSKVDFQTSVRLSTEADNLGKEWSVIDVFSKTIDARHMLTENPVDLVTLRRTYSDARAALRAEEESRLGLLGQQLETARNQKTAKQKQFGDEFPGVTKANIKPYEGQDHNSLLPGLDAQVQETTAATELAGQKEAVVANESQEWHRKNRDVMPATPDEEALDLATLEAERTRAAELTVHAQERQRKADTEADSASKRAVELGRFSTADAEHAKMLRASLELGDAPEPELLALRLQELSGGEPDMNPLPVVPETNAGEQVTKVIAEHNAKGKATQGAEKRAKAQFDALKDAVTEKSFQDAEPELATVMRSNDFTSMCSDSRRLLEGLNDRIGVTQDSLDGMQADFDSCAGELLNFSRDAISLLTQACQKKVPNGALYVGGKAILKMRANFSSIALDTRRQVINRYLDELIDTNLVPKNGADLVSAAVLRIYGKDLGIQFLKMVPEEARQYASLEHISNSGGEGVVMAMFLYAVMSQLRSETQASPNRAAGGPLILDNPFAKATLAAMWQAQRLLAQAMGIQLVFASAIQDYNTLGEFPYIIRVAKAGTNSKTQRTHLRAVSVSFNQDLARAA
jgi:hypothetical protein